MIAEEKRAKGKVRGIVWRDGGWWYNRTFKGIRRWFNLETKDFRKRSSGSKNCLRAPRLSGMTRWKSIVRVS